MTAYRAKLIDRGEVLECCDGTNTYTFDVCEDRGAWTVYLPCHKNGRSTSHQLSDEERTALFPAIQDFLRKRRWLGLVPRTRSIRFQEK